MNVIFTRKPYPAFRMFRTKNTRWKNRKMAPLYKFLGVLGRIETNMQPTP